ncbi:MAG: HIRAN domain-containing protein [Firmicutes bacterium]|nr:HIRAN domain-containing protein [Bacillota bacterium]
MDGKRYVAVVGCRYYFGGEILRPGQVLRLVKEPDNPYDDEAIRVELPSVGRVGYLANSVHTVPRGCCSAGRIYDTFAEETTGTVRFVVGMTAIVELEG